ncbi:hypothetical protein [Clostridium coskatii]|uniref:Uncharacterized protein n=1 Tax=Clostridium coskatii TaxID=1705578 RepID=A0A166TTG4_9CLOT|nr:hypothetical protein [Clostridium coskatii]OAA94070.1 hypothetical protein WX73_03640 [Clostridium coskatii]OBR96632.1 hypothetical protein CLCOS_07940 [Clostridium coskatii]
MVITNIVPCIKIVKEDSMSGCDLYIELGDLVKIKDHKDKLIIGKLSFIELGKDESEDDIIYISTDNETIINIGTSYIKDIDIIHE